MQVEPWESQVDASRAMVESSIDASRAMVESSRCK